MHKDDDMAFAGNYAEREQASALREPASEGGLRFEAFLPPAQADWLLQWIEQGHFVDPAEAVSAIVQNFIDLELHRDLSNELCRRMLAQAAAELAHAYAGDDSPAKLDARYFRNYPAAARWEKIQR